MNRSSRNQEVIVFLCRNLVDILFCVEHQFAFLCLTQIVDHRFFINARFHSQINYGIFFRIYHVVTFILCIVHTETITDKLSGRMHLQTQITSAHRIQKVETDGEVFSKACFHRFTKQLFTFQQNQIDRRKFEAHSVHLKIEAVFFGHTVKAPAKIFAFTIQVANFFHPSQGAGSKKGTTRNGVFTVASTPLKKVSLSIIFGVPATWVSIQNSTLSNNLSLYLSHTLQSLK